MSNTANIRILVVGGASLDRLDGADGLVAGGAGMYTAMASHRNGAAVTLFAPRPEPVPEALGPVAQSLTWLGPAISREELAHFEIRYAEGRTHYVQAFFGAEAALRPDALPADLSAFDCVHLVPLGDITLQREFLLACRERGARRISAGTAFDLIDREPQAAADVMNACDYFFMNEEEAERLFGSVSGVVTRPGQAMFVTRGGAGATVVLGRAATHVHPVAATASDPTGAGDTFCGATLAGLAFGEHPVMAARRAMPLAARMIESVGPAELLRPPPPPTPPPDARVAVNADRVAQVAAMISAQDDFEPFPFTGPDLPPEGHPAALDYFFATTLQQFGFWSTAGDRYDRPLVATLDGAERKGAFYLFRGYCRWLDAAPGMLTPAAHAELEEADLRAVLAADDGGQPMPAFELHLELAREYGRDMLALGMTPQAIVAQANRSSAPLATLLTALDHVGGYKEDPLRKKSGLLAMVLQQRPERFLRDNGEAMPPVVDYHVMRSCLRIGLVDVSDETLASRLRDRRLLAADEEWAVRGAAHAAVEQVVRQSGKTMGAVDWFFFQARRRCPEMTAPLCDTCAVDTVCAHRKELFQPVMRTSFY